MREYCDSVYKFGSFRLEPAERRLVRDDVTVCLTPKAFDTLCFLVARAGHLVEKEQLMSALWPDSFVEEANLAQQIWTLRKTLGVNDDGKPIIETVARKGFRFVAPVVEEKIGTFSPVVQEQFPPSDVATSVGRTHFPRTQTVVLVAASVIALLIVYALITKAPAKIVETSKAEVVSNEVRSIAVLPFKPVSKDSRNESLQMGMTETLITHLSNLQQLVVRPMGAVRQYVDPEQDPLKVGRELNVDAVVDGSIQKVGNRVRVTVRLTDIQTGAALWAQQFDEKFTDIFNVQDSISERVATSLPLKLNAKEQQLLTKRYTDSPEAYQLYLQAQYLWDNRTKENRQKMFQYYQQAIDRDPKFALAYVGIADLQITLVGDNQVAYKEIKPKIDSNLAKALELDSDLAQARNLLAEVKYQFDYDWAGAEKEFKRAIELNPNVASIHLAYGWFLMSLGRFDESSIEMQRAQELDPHSMVINRSRGRLLFYMHRYDEAIEHLQRIVNAEPKVSLNHWVLAETYEKKGMYDQAIDEGAAASTIDCNSEKITKVKQLVKESGWPAYLQTQRDVLLNNASNGGYVSPINLAKVNAGIGDVDQAFYWLDKAIDERSSGIPGLKVDPVYDSLHSDPRFAKLLQRLNLQP